MLNGAKAVSIMAFNIMTLGITMFNITTLSVTGLIEKLSIL
jgi:hypothetical protein